MDDLATNLVVAKAMLQHLGCSVVTAPDGAKAIEKYENENFDLVLMDIQMPVMDGVQATKALKAKHIQTAPIIALTANALLGDREKYLGEGLDDYIAKPINFEAIVAVLKKWFPQGRKP